MTKEEKIAELKAECDDKGIKYHHASGIDKLTELLTINNTPDDETTLDSVREYPDDEIIPEPIKLKTIEFSEKDHKKAWQTLNKELAKVKDADYIIIHSKGFEFPFEDPYDAVKQLNNIGGAYCLSLYPLPSYKGQWTGKTPEKKGDFFLSNWVDNNFIAHRSFFEAFNWTLERIKDWNPNNKSNGTGAYMSRKAVEKGLNLYHL